MTLCQDWVTRADVGQCGCTEVPNPQIVEEALAAGSEILYVLSGRQYPGLCEVTFRPCGSLCRCDFDSCGCNRYPRVFLGFDVVTISQVDIAGEVLDEAAYFFDDGHLIRTDGGAWPCCQNIGAAIGEPDTFTVTGTVGAEPTALAKRAAVALVSELVKSCVPSETCALPARVTSLTREGVSMAILDPMEFLDQGRTGIYIVDLFLSTVNPGGLTRRSSAWSPDLPTTLRQAVPSS